MNVKLHTPKTLKAGSGLSSAKQFFLSLLATSISIVLTFGTAAIIDHHKKEAAKKEMVMMVISDMDKSIEQVMAADTILQEASRLQQELAVHPEFYDSLRFSFLPVMKLLNSEFPETAERIFTTNIETFNTIGDANFVNEVSSFYIVRHKYQEAVINQLTKEGTGKEAGMSQSIKALFDVNFPEFYFNNWSFLASLKQIRGKCMLMMDISEKDMESFNRQQIDEVDNPENTAQGEQMIKEFEKAEALIFDMQEKLKD